MKLKIENIIKLFDEKENSNAEHISSVNQMLGEELAVQLFKHYLESVKGSKVLLSDKPVKAEGKKGHWLDAWILSAAENIVYQTEIKNWTSYSLGGWTVPINISDEDLRTITEKEFRRRWDETQDDLKDKPAQKVLKQMNYANYFTASTINPKVLPLLIFWMPVASPKSKDSINTGFSIVELKNHPPFKELHIFSISLYLRYLLKQGISSIDIDMPKLGKRIELINSILK